MGPKEFWNEIVTGKSWEVLLGLRKLPFDFILIGGWAAYLWTKASKSKDVDIVLTDFKALDYLKQHYDLRKNERLRKYEIKVGGIDVDIYIPFFSRLAIPPEDLKSHSTVLEGFRIASPEALLVLKQAAELGRRGSMRGEKDRLDILGLLLNSEIDFGRYRVLLKKYGLEGMAGELSRLISEFDVKNLPYLELDRRGFKLRKLRLLEELRESG